ncbi:hypothetical protein BJY52DRAFT_1189178 [Lactarius psammicola]|nr:hypothetical protein BJY52DRAFT_1189178 [Lactarius psammicola]
MGVLYTNPFNLFIRSGGEVDPLLIFTATKDLVSSFGVGELKDGVIRLTNNFDPYDPKGLGIHWSQSDLQKPKGSLVISQDSALFPLVRQRVNGDNLGYRTDPLDYVANISLLRPI